MTRFHPPTKLNVTLPDSARRVLQGAAAQPRPNFRRALSWTVLAVIAFVFGQHLGGLAATGLRDQLLSVGCAAAFAVCGAAATRAVAEEAARLSIAYNAKPAAGALRLIILLAGYLIVGVGVLDLLSIPLGQLLLGGAVTGVIVGIAAQQMLGNVFAGLVLLLSRPYSTGQHIRVNSGALGGPFEGTVARVDLLYTALDADGELIQIPNSAMLASAVSTPN